TTPRNTAAETLRQKLVVHGVVVTRRAMRPPLLQHTAAHATSSVPLPAILDRIRGRGLVYSTLRNELPNPGAEALNDTQANRAPAAPCRRRRDRAAVLGRCCGQGQADARVARGLR